MMSSSFPKSSIIQSASLKLSMLPLPYVTPQVRVPVRESDTLIDQTTLEAKIRRGIEEYEQGKVHKTEEGESVDGFLSRMINED